MCFLYFNDYISRNYLESQLLTNQMLKNCIWNSETRAEASFSSCLISSCALNECVSALQVISWIMRWTGRTCLSGQKQRSHQAPGRCYMAAIKAWRDVCSASAGRCAAAPATEPRQTRAERRGDSTECITSTRWQGQHALGQGQHSVHTSVTNCVCVQVEMFGVTADETGEESSQLLGEFVSLQKEMFSALGLHYR